VVICLEQGADLHMAQLMLLPLTVTCFSRIQIGFTFLVPAHLGSPGQRAVKRLCVCVPLSPPFLCACLPFPYLRHLIGFVDFVAAVEGLLLVTWGPQK